MEFRYRNLSDCIVVTEQGIDLEQRALTIAVNMLDPQEQIRRGIKDPKMPTIKEIKAYAAKVLREFADNFDSKPLGK